MAEKTVTDRELTDMGREVASAMLKGSLQGVKPSKAVPVVSLMYVTDAHGYATLEPAEFSKLAQAMEETLAEAERWEETQSG